MCATWEGQVTQPHKEKVLAHTITRRIELDAGHRVPRHESKCKSLHGHRYVVVATLGGVLHTEGPETGMVMDFGFIKEDMNLVIHDRYDHGLILAHDDVETINMFLPDYAERLAAGSGLDWKPASAFFTYAGPHKLAIIEKAPTAENLAELWFHQLEQRLGERHPKLGWALREIAVHETPNCVARYVR
jgi:6-pyruvoyltetrahydropterin/6-carboxytetrahydropterin synthase